MYKFKKKIGPYLFILPHYLAFLVFFAIPAAMAIYISLCNWDFVSKPHFVGIKNYIMLLTDKDSYYFNLFWSSFKNTLGYVLVSVPLLVCVSLLLAVALSKIKKGSGVFEGTEKVLCEVKENKSIANVENNQHLQCFFDIIIVSRIGGETHGRTTAEINFKSIYGHL